MAAIEFQNVSKCFSRSGGSKLLRVFLKERLQKRHREAFYALRDVSFRVEQGESMAIIGANGAGKSTLLSLVAGLTRPNEGRLEVNGKVAALLELGTGFHPDLTGSENVLLNASILGLSRKRARECFDSILDFAGIGDFIQQPIRTYSSGMVMRLAFAVAIHVEPDILIIDEVLAVGDAAFQEKCFERICELKRAGKTLLFVSHAPEMVKHLCDHSLWLEHGRVKAAGPPAELLEAYAGHAPHA
ncbi:MAG TPA: ABC transporter ATP-binding protein [Bryobacteraceae bacterium]|nr:ABC transporter ATP-binding protein [Bryobacteraceae bacterium]